MVIIENYLHSDWSLLLLVNVQGSLHCKQGGDITYTPARGVQNTKHK